MNKYQIAQKKPLTPEITQISVYAPLVAAKAKAGQFIILRVERGGGAHPPDHLQRGERPGDGDLSRRSAAPP